MTTTAMPDVAPRNGFQKRIDKLTRQRYELEAENAELRKLLDRYEITLQKYKAVFARRTNQHGK